VGEVTDARVLVLGTGAAGLVAALSAYDEGADVTVLEKSAKVGGTTALSGGVMWLPDNLLARAAGVDDSRDDALSYLGSLSNDMIMPEIAEAFVDHVDETLEWIAAHTPLDVHLVDGYPDYHPEHPGGKPGGGRSCEPDLFSVEAVGLWRERIAGSPRRLRNRESPLGGGTGVLEPDVHREREEHSIEGGGRALVAGLLAACLERGIEPRTEARAIRLVVDDGTVCGVELESPLGREVVRSDAVVIATGGFEYDPDLTRDFLRGPMSLPAGVPSNTGDGLRMAMRAGAALGNMREAWWVPVVQLPGQRADGGNNVLLLLRERTLPRSIMVNAAGQRFTNEAVNYNALGSALHALDPASLDYANQPCWLVFDDEFVTRYGGFGCAIGSVPEWVTRADTLDGLARAIGVPAERLVATVARWNGLVAGGRDDDFGRGDSAYDWWCGDRSVPPGHDSTLGPLETGPFYAVEVISSCLGTKGGPRTTVTGQVLDVDGAPIPGLFAAGNAMAAPTGMVYGGAGGTLGPAVVFGRIAGRSAAAVQRPATRNEVDHVSQ
jgi:succinate dehydrogenase/fumarate reductase flavoprotein subunit